MDTFNNYISTAMRCSSYDPATSNAVSNSMNSTTSCIYCKNFQNNHCQLDKYDQINARR